MSATECVDHFYWLTILGTGYQNSRLVYTGYQNSGLVHKQQPADGAAPGRHVVAPQVICSKPRPLARPQHSLKVNSSRR